MSETVPHRSPRTADAPMAFTGGELVRGLFVAWITFVVLLLVALVIAAIVSDAVTAVRPGFGHQVALLPVMLLYGAGIGGSVSFIVMLVLSPVVWLVGRSLRTHGSIGIHLGVYSVLGIVIGVVAVWAPSFVQNGGSEALGGPLLPITVAITTTSVVFGWLRASRQARRELRLRDPRSPLGLDQAFDDTASY